MIQYMNYAKSILWYDLETFGLNPRVDRIAQAALIRTDLQLNIIEEPVLLYCRLTDDYLPNPESCIVTGLTPQEVNEKGIREYDFIKKINDMFLVPGTVAAGFNNVNFDDECIRSTLYRNLFDPFEREYKEGRSRWDIMNLVRATKDLRPDGIDFSAVNPDTGFTSFKLTDITSVNHIEQEGAHDALVDVRATIDVARLIRDKQPKLFNYAFSHRFKNEVWAVLDPIRHQAVLHTSAAYVSERGNTHPVLPLMANKERGNEIYCFDLTFPIPETLEGIEDLREAGIIRIMANKCPFVAPMSVMNESCEKRLGFTRSEVEEKAEKIRRSHRYLFDLTEALNVKKDYEAESDADYTIYDRFMSEADKAKLKEISRLQPQDKLKAGEYNFEDEKYHKLLWRMVARNWPESMSGKEKVQWRNFCASRLINPPSKYARPLELYLRECREHMDSIETAAKDKLIYKALYDYGIDLEKRILA